MLNLTKDGTNRYRGYAIERGSCRCYTGTRRDRADRWYIDGPAGLRDRSGAGYATGGYATVAAAMAAIDERLGVR